jgi:hypothetical protein
MLPLVFVSLLCLFVLSSFGKAYNSERLFERDTALACACVSSATEFQTNTSLTDSASAAPEPPGYVNVFKSGISWPTEGVWLGFTELDEYDNSICAALCDVSETCASFAICELLIGVMNPPD